MRASNTLYELLENSIKEYKDNIAYSMFGGEDVTYAEVGRRVAIVQQMLLDAGLGAGDKVAILSSNMPNWGVCYFAVVSAGMVAVPILPDFTEKELDMLIRHSGAKALFVSDKLFTKLSKETVAMLDIVIRTKNLGVISQRTTGKGVRRVPQPDDLAVIIYTSGTMSRPKGVMLTHYNLASNVNMMYGLFPIDEHDSMLSVLPLSHTYECTVGMLYPFAAGGRVTYLEKPPTASILLPALRAVRPTCFLIVPLIIEKIYRSQIYAKFTSNAFWRKVYGNDFLRRQIHRLAGRRLMKVFGGRLRFLGIGGAKLNTQVEQFLVESRIPYAIGYGLTETAPMVAGAVPAMPRKVGSTGRAMEGLQVRLDNVNPETRQGEIVINSPSMMKGYYKNEAATAEAFTSDGWFRTGDLGCIDEDGVIYIKGRLKNMIVGPSGENIYPEEIESVLNTNTYVSESIVTQQDGHLVALIHFDKDAIEKLKGELMEKWEITRDDWHRKVGEWNAKKEEIKQEIMRYVNSKVNKFSRITEVVEEDAEFEKTPTQKIRRFKYNGNAAKESDAAAEWPASSDAQTGERDGGAVPKPVSDETALDSDASGKVR